MDINAAQSSVQVKLSKALSFAVVLKALGVLLFFLPFFCSEKALAANRYYYNESDSIVAIKEIRDSLEDMRHEISNHEAEIRMIEEKLNSLDAIIETLRDQMSESSKSHKEQLKGNSASLENKITSLENTSKGLVSDLKQFKTYTNESTLALTQYKSKIADLEKIIEQQNNSIDHLQSAMRSLTELMQIKESAAIKEFAATTEKSDGTSYRVKPGDSLEKIAKNHQTTVQAIKEINGLTSDKIVVGKLIKIPEK